MIYKDFELVSNFKPTGDQPQAIENLVNGLKDGKKIQVLQGATGTGKTFTMANIIAKVNKPTLVLVHNKTLAGQLYSEFKELFPNNRVEYFVSNFDFYQPEAYIPSTDTYIEKNAVMNQEIEMLRTSAINSVLERSDTIIVGSVASIYGLSDPDEYFRLVFDIRVGEKIDIKEFFNKLVNAQYTRTNMDLDRGLFRSRGDIIEFMPASSKDTYIKVDIFDDEIESIKKVNFVTSEIIESYKTFPIFPAYDHVATHQRILSVCDKIMEELRERVEYFKSQGKPLEAERIDMRVRQDVESLIEFGMCPGIENYSLYIDGREKGSRPFCLIDYFPKDFLLFVDESHATLPQIRGMYAGDRSRKENLVNYGFRLPTALDNRPLKFEEFESIYNQLICTSATPGPYELEKTDNKVVEQIIRPTGLLDPIIHVRKTEGQIDDIQNEINKRLELNERTIITTLTVKMAKDLTDFLKSRGYKVVYLHHECKTLERTQIIYDFRRKKYDVLVGINLLREGLDIPELSLICILDADKEGFLRSSTSLIQICGRAARNVNGTVIMYADTITQSMKYCIDETARRRAIQEQYNIDNGIVPTTVEKPIFEPIHNSETIISSFKSKSKQLSKKQIEKEIAELEKQMKKYANEYNFEKAIEIRDVISEIREKYNLS